MEPKALAVLFDLINSTHSCKFSYTSISYLMKTPLPNIYIFFIQFSLCLEDLIPVALGRYLKALISSIHQTDHMSCAASNSSEHHLEKMFSLFMEQVAMWSDICGLPEIKSSELTESCLFG